MLVHTQLKVLNGPWKVAEEGHQKKTKSPDIRKTRDDSHTLRVHQLGAFKSVKASRMSWFGVC